MTGKSRYLLSDKVQSLSNVLAKIVTITDYGLDNLYNKTISFKTNALEFGIYYVHGQIIIRTIAIGLTAV